MNPILKFASDQVETKSPDVDSIRPDPPTLPSLLWRWLSPTSHRILPRMPFTASQHKHEKRPTALISTHPGAVGAVTAATTQLCWCVHCSPVCVDFSCSSTRSVNKLFNTTTIIYSTISHKLFSPLLALYTNCIQSVNFRIILLGYVNKQVNMQGWLIQLEYIIFHFIVNTH